MASRKLSTARRSTVETPRPVVLTGSRGVGKAILLGEAAVHAADRYSWLMVPMEVRRQTPFIPQPVDRLVAVRELYDQAPTGKHVTITAAKIRASQLPDASGGYPYEIQLLGHHAWRVSSGADFIEKAPAAPAIDAAQQELSNGLFVARWGDASPREQEYLPTLAGLLTSHTRVTGAMVAIQLGRPPRPCRRSASG